MGSQHPSDIQSPKPAGWQELLGLQYSQLFFSHVLHPLWPCTFHFRQRVLNHIPLHRTALARLLLLPPQLWQSDGKSPVVFCAGKFCCAHGPALLLPGMGPLRGGCRAAPLIHIYTVFPRVKANPSAAAAAFPQGIPPFIAMHSQS